MPKSKAMGIIRVAKRLFEEGVETLYSDEEIDKIKILSISESSSGGEFQVQGEVFLGNGDKEDVEMVLALREAMGFLGGVDVILEIRVR